MSHIFGTAPIVKVPARGPTVSRKATEARWSTPRRTEAKGSQAKRRFPTIQEAADYLDLCRALLTGPVRRITSQATMTISNPFTTNPSYCSPAPEQTSRQFFRHHRHLRRSAVCSATNGNDAEPSRSLDGRSVITDLPLRGHRRLYTSPNSLKTQPW